MSKELSPEERAIVADEILRAEVGRFLAARERPASLLDRVGKSPPANILLGFVLTGILGAWITSSFQVRSDEFKREADGRAGRREAALRVVDSLGLVLNDVSRAFDQYLTSINQHWSVARQDSARVEFERVKTSLLKRDIVDAARLCEYFGASLNQRYGALTTQLKFTDVYIREYDARTKSSVESTPIEHFIRDSLEYAADTAYYHMRDSIASFTLDLVNQLNVPISAGAPVYAARSDRCKPPRNVIRERPAPRRPA